MSEPTSPLDSSFADFEQAVKEALPILKRHVEGSRSGSGRVIQLRPVSEIMEQLELAQWVRDGNMNARSFSTFLDQYLTRSTHLHHPGYMAHQVAVPDLAAALADFVHGITNNPVAVYEMGPAGATIELFIIDWMLEKVGWRRSNEPAQRCAPAGGGGGVLTHGGSLANLTGLLAARATVAPAAWAEGVTSNLVILAPPSAHYSVRKAASIMGLGTGSAQQVDVDEKEVIRPDRLPNAVRRAREEGKEIIALVANACATSTGLHDPLHEIGSFCREERLWLHVDGAHGASALVSETEKRYLRGIELADSLTWDAHKMLRTSGLCTAILFREAAAAERVFQQAASYLFDGAPQAGIDLAHRTIECTKAPLGLKVFLLLAFRGEAGIARYVEQQYALTRRFHTQIESRDGFECPYVPEANILCFRYGDDDASQLTIRKRLLDDGRFHITSTTINGRRYLRLSVMSPHTNDRTIKEMLDAIEGIGRELRSHPQ